MKPLQSDGAIQLNPQSASTLLGAQMSTMWIAENILRYIDSPDPELKEIGILLRTNKEKIGRAVSAIDKLSEELLVLFLGQ